MPRGSRAPGLRVGSAAVGRPSYSRPVRMATLSDSLMGYGEGVPTYVEVMSNQRLRFADPDGGVRNVFSYPGQDTAYLLTQIGAVTGLTTKPDACLVQGGTNDVIASTPLATIIANIEAICGKLEAAGIRPIMSTLPPLGGSFQQSAKRQPARLVNLALRRLAQRNGRLLVDPYTLMVDGVTASYQTAYDSGDNLHPSPAGIKAWAQHIIDRTATLGTVDLSLLERVNDANALLVSLRLAAGNGNFGGAANAGLASEFGATAAVAGFTPSLVASDIPNVNWQRITAAGASASQTIYQANVATVAGGQLIQAAVRVRTGQDLAGSDRVQVYMRTYAGATEKGNFQLTGPVGLSRQIADGVLMATFKVPAGATNAQLNWIIPPTAGTYDLAQPSIYNLTALGLA